MLDDIKCGVAWSCYTALMPLIKNETMRRGWVGFLSFIGQIYPSPFGASSHKSSMIHWYFWQRYSHQFWVVRDWPDKPIKYPSTIHKISITYLQHIHKNVLKVSMFPTPKSPVTPTSHHAPGPEAPSSLVGWDPEEKLSCPPTWIQRVTKSLGVNTPQILWLEKCFDRFLEEKTRKLFCLKVWLYDILSMAQKTKYSYQDQIIFYLYAKPVSSFEICVKCDFFQGKQEIQYTVLDMFD